MLQRWRTVPQRGESSVLNVFLDNTNEMLFIQCKGNAAEFLINCGLAPTLKPEITDGSKYSTSPDSLSPDSIAPNLTAEPTNTSGLWIFGAVLLIIVVIIVALIISYILVTNNKEKSETSTEPKSKSFYHFINTRIQISLKVMNAKIWVKNLCHKHRSTQRLTLL